MSGPLELRGERLQSPTGRRIRIPNFTGTERRTKDRVMRENVAADKNDARSARNGEEDPFLGTERIVRASRRCHYLE